MLDPRPFAMITDPQPWFFFTCFYILLLTALRVEETWERTPEVLFLCCIVDSTTRGGDVGAYAGSTVFMLYCWQHYAWRRRGSVRRKCCFYVVLLTALRVEETWERTPEVLWKHVARELMRSAIADKKVRISSRIYIFQNADPGPGLLFRVDPDPTPFGGKNYLSILKLTKRIPSYWSFYYFYYFRLFNVYGRTLNAFNSRSEYKRLIECWSMLILIMVCQWYWSGSSETSEVGGIWIQILWNKDASFRPFYTWNVSVSSVITFKCWRPFMAFFFLDVLSETDPEPGKNDLKGRSDPE